MKNFFIKVLSVLLGIGILNYVIYKVTDINYISSILNMTNSSALAAMGAGYFFDESKCHTLAEKAYDACNEQDFDKAHKYLREIKGIPNSIYNGLYTDPLEHVLQEEIAFLISTNEEQAAKRIGFLLQQHLSDCYSRWEVVDNSLKLAESQQNECAIEILKHFK